MKKDYSVAAFVLNIVGFVGWLCVAAGAISAVVNAGARDGGLLIAAGAGLALAGLILVASGQLMAATIDTAQTNASLLEGQSRQLAELQAISYALTPRNSAPATEPAQPATAPAAPPPTPSVYRAYNVYQRPDGSVFASGRVFASMDDARDFIDQQLKNNP